MLTYEYSLVACCCQLLHQATKKFYALEKSPFGDKANECVLHIVSATSDDDK